MSNKEALKAGYAQCKMDHRNQVRCVPTGLSGVTGIKESGIWIDGDTGMVTAIEVKVRHEGWPKNDVFQEAIEQLKISRCPIGWNTSGEEYLGWCYIVPNHVRLVERHKGKYRNSSWYSIDVIAKTDGRQVEAFLKSKQNKAVQDATVKRIAEGN